MLNKKQNLFGIEIDAIRMPDAVACLHEWLQCEDQACRFVVTPNVDHAVMLQTNRELRAAYKNAALVLADGHPLVWASRLLGCSLPERVPGSDLVPKFFDSCQDLHRPVRVFLLGAAPGVGMRAAEKIHRHWRGVEIVGIYSPPVGFEKDANENEIILGRIALARPDVVIVGLGAPKQEVWIQKHRDQIRAKVALCVGATIDFLAGEKRRAAFLDAKIRNGMVASNAQRTKEIGKTVRQRRMGFSAVGYAATFLGQLVSTQLALTG